MPKSCPGELTNMHVTLPCTVQSHYITVKRLWLLQLYFGYLTCIPIVYVTHKVQEVLRIYVVKKLPSFVKLVSPFRKPINQHIW